MPLVRVFSFFTGFLEHLINFTLLFLIMLFAGINPTKGMWNQTVVLKTITDFKAARNLTQAQEQGITQLALDAQVVKLCLRFDVRSTLDYKAHTQSHTVKTP